MVVNRTEIRKECSQTGLNLEQVLKNKLAAVEEKWKWDVQPERSEIEQEKLDEARNNLVNGSFGENACEGSAGEEVPEERGREMAENFFGDRKSRKNYIIHVSDEILALLHAEFSGEVFAIGREETSRYYVLTGSDEDPAKSMCNSIGLIVSNEIFSKLMNPSVEVEEYDFFGTCFHGEWLFYRTDRERSFMTLLPFNLVTDLYSRNTGLLESKIMLEKKVLIAGAGSVGSFIALELARAGVGCFVLCDDDILEIHNICRHQLGWKDVGRYKVDAVKDAILNINPTARVEVFHGFLQDMPESFTEGVNLIIGTGDNREANAFANDLAEFLKIPFVNTGCWARAHAGEVFYWRPEEGMLTYRKAFANLISGERAASHANYFADEEEERTLHFEPGVSSDIAFVTIVAIKLIYDLLNAGSNGYTPRVLDYLKQYTLVCNTNKACIGGENAEMFPNPLYISNNIVLKG